VVPVVCGSALAMGCGGGGENATGGSGGSGGGSMLSGGAGSGGAGAPGSGGSAGDVGSTGGASSVDAGQVSISCEDLTVACNGVCLSDTNPSSGKCSIYARVDGGLTMALASNGDIFVGTYTGPPLFRVPAGGGTAEPMLNTHYYLQSILVEDADLFFLSQNETPPNSPRSTGSIVRVPRAGGAEQVLASGVPDGSFDKTADHFYVGAQDILPGLRRFDIDGTNPTLLTDVDVMDLKVVGDQIYFIDDSYRLKPVKRMPLGGGTATAFGTGQCQYVLGSDSQYLYAQCNGPTRIAFSDGATEKLGDAHSGASHAVLAGQYVYYTYYSGASPRKLERLSVANRTVETIATLQASRLVEGLVATDTAVYVLVDQGYGFPPKPGFILKIAL
jgi:hypothetical protein